MQAPDVQKGAFQNSYAMLHDGYQSGGLRGNMRCKPMQQRTSSHSSSACWQHNTSHGSCAKPGVWASSLSWLPYLQLPHANHPLVPLPHVTMSRTSKHTTQTTPSGASPSQQLA